jgi:hypothetical protein
MFFLPGKSLQTFSLSFSLCIEFYLTGKEEMKVERQNFFTISLALYSVAFNFVLP